MIFLATAAQISIDTTLVVNILAICSAFATIAGYISEKLRKEDKARNKLSRRQEKLRDWVISENDCQDLRLEDIENFLELRMEFRPKRGLPRRELKWDEDNE